MSNKRLILVTGMHRSGTSMVAHLLKDVGVPFGDDLLDDSEFDNIEGYGEHRSIVDIHERLLETLNRSWHGEAGSMAMPSTWQFWPEAQLARKHVEQILRHEFESTDLLAVKDPRLCRLLPLWANVLGEMKVKTSVVICVRDPRLVAASLSVRNAMPFQRAVAIWQRHYIDLFSALDKLENMDPNDVVVADYDRLIDFPRHNVEELLSSLAVNASEVCIERAVGRIKSTLRHHIAGSSEPAGDELEKDAEALLIELRTQPFVRKAQVDTQVQQNKPVTIVVRVGGRDLFLSRALRSILSQTHEDWHVVVVNDGGNANSIADLIYSYNEAFGNRISIINFADRQGMEAASNAAIGSRSDDYVAIHDDDDTWHADFLETGLCVLEQTGFDGVVTGCEIVEEKTIENEPVFVSSRPFLPFLGEITLADLAIANRFPPISFFYRRSLYDRVGIYREDLPVLGDWDFNVRVLSTMPIVYRPEVKARWHRRAQDDRWPNSDDVLHRQVERRLRDEWARSSFKSVLTFTPLVAELKEEIARLKESLSHEHHFYRSALEESMQWRIHPCSRRNIVDVATESGLQASVTDDPQWIYELPTLLEQGRFLIQIVLEVMHSDVASEIFWSESDVFASECSVRLHNIDDGLVQACFQADRPVKYLRVDPVEKVCLIKGGPLTIRRLSSRH